MQWFESFCHRNENSTLNGNKPEEKQGNTLLKNLGDAGESFVLPPSSDSLAKISSQRDGE